MTGKTRGWDIVSGIGITALAVAAARAVETSRDDGLVRDPFAGVFVEAASPPIPMPTRSEPDAPDHVVWDHMSRFVGVRSRFFDEFLTGALASGPGQVVILAAGLDSRAFRLDQPQGTTVFEIDQPRVLEFKDQVLEARGATPRCDRRVVPADLREDWASSLGGAGFDRETPTIWLVEGLLPYLPDDLATTLLDVVHGLSAKGSVLAAEHFDDTRPLRDDPEVAELSKRFSIDFQAMLDQGGTQLDPGKYLGSQGWQGHGESANALSQRYGKPLEGFSAKVFGGNGHYFTGTLEG
ncbi:SAM-dependent methyltransferase [Amycolatopsis pigmentata]|uniref:S-adenosyl-L-methionine-dependent methyltransferase n=1 Tax=Amycolatopsis pigmentata TaxID=450801 RepID=A0ABW5FRI8_9PSEU